MTSRSAISAANPRLSILVAGSEPPLKGVEVRGEARFIDDAITETAVRIRDEVRRSR